MKNFNRIIVLCISLCIFSSDKIKDDRHISEPQERMKPVAFNSANTYEDAFLTIHISSYHEMSGRASRPSLEQNEWRQCVKCFSLYYNGFPNKGRCPFGNGHLLKTTPNRNYLLTYNSNGSGQRNWRFCNKCNALFYDGFPGKGVCKAGGAHLAQGFNFTLKYDIRPTAENTWRFCNKCQTLFFDGEQKKGVCAAGGGHVSAGFHFVLISGQLID